MVCLLAAPWVQLSVSADSGWPHNALRHHWLMSISCHFRDCKALLVTSLTHASVQTFTFTIYRLSSLPVSLVCATSWKRNEIRQWRIPYTLLTTGQPAYLRTLLNHYSPTAKRRHCSSPRHWVHSQLRRTGLYPPVGQTLILVGPVAMQHKKKFKILYAACF